MSKLVNAMGASLMLTLMMTSTASAYARNIPHADLVKMHVQSGQHKQVLKGCKAPRMTAPAVGAGHELECWAASTANELEKQPKAVSSMVLNDAGRKAALSRCGTLGIEQRIKSPECEAASRADSFISLRLPRTASTLQPVKFK